MKRNQTSFLVNWINSTSRKPLIIRGARQVGKTWLIRNLASSSQKELIELNFEKRPDLESLFKSNDPKEILSNISVAMNIKTDLSKSILFLDEIQSAPHLFEKLRWFAEDLPELPVIAAGSLLDFTLAKHKFSMPVGRISYLYLEPLSFEEFLDAVGQHKLCLYLKNYNWNIDIPNTIHSQLMKLIKEYIIVGGMPTAVSSWATSRSPNAINQLHIDLLTTYRDDFTKYNGRLSTEHLENIMNSVPRQLGQKFTYSDVNSEAKSAPLKQALDLLSKARICHKIIKTSANGLPLGAETNEKFLKIILLDCGLCNASLGLSLHQLESVSEISMINNGNMAEQLTGQLLRTIPPFYIDPSLYYWAREKIGSQAEVDYIIQHENQIIPLEVKAGTTGTLKSLHQYMKEKKKHIAIRINSDIPSLTQIKLNDASNIEYKLLSLPFYLLEQLPRLINSYLKKNF